jgi:hypothetical protein
MIKYKLHATIGLPNYSNLQPEVELEGDNLDELHATAMAHIDKVWADYGTPPQRLKIDLVAPENGLKPSLKIETSFTGEIVHVDELNHKYYDSEGNVLLSGSAYANANSPKFDKGAILPKTAKSWGVQESELDGMWELGARVSNEYGSAIHSALEAWSRYKDVGAKIAETKGLEYNYALPKNTHIRDIVLSFDKLLGKVGTISEVLVSDIANKMVGRIDLLEILDMEKKVCRVGDYKTNNDLDDKKIKKYQLQLSYYAHTLINHGWTVEGLDIFHYNGETWNKIELEVLDLVG